MNKILKYLNIQIILVILVNIFFADITVISIPLLLFGLLIGAGGNEILFVYVCIIMLIISFIRLLVLPILYTILEKKSKNEIIQKFIYNLKHNNKFKLTVLIICFLPIFLYITISNITDIINLDIDFHGYFATLFICEFIWGLFGSYLVLFIYWYIKDKITKKRQKPQ